MVLSNKKLKQKLRSLLAESLATSESQANLNDSQTFKSLLNSVTQKPKLSKREIRRVKNPPTQDLENEIEVKQSEPVDAGLKKNNKRKREKDVTEGSEKKIKIKKKKKKKKVVKKEEEGVQTTNGGTQEQTEAIQIQTQTSKEESICTKIYVGGIPYYSTVDDIQSFFEGCGSITEIDCLNFPETGKFNGIAMISFRTEAAAKRALALDGSDMGGLSLKIQPYKATRDKKVPDFAPAMLEGYNRIYVGNLSWDMTTDELKKFFSDCRISSIRLGKDKETEEFKGFAHVDFADSLSLTMALKLDQKPLFGRPVRIRCAVPPKSVNSGSKVDLAISNGRIVDDDVARKAKRQTCYDCGEKGHLSSSCPNKKAADVAHMSNTTDDVVFDEVETDKIGDGKVKRRTCYECGEKGHLSSSCPNKKAANGAHAVYRTDVLAFDKDEKEADNVGDGKLKRRTCYECGERGHLSSSCPNKNAADGAHAGNRTDDLAFDKDEKEADNVGDGKLKRRTCYECGERGHLSSSCPNKKAADGAHAGNRTDDLAFDKDEKEADNVGDGKLKRRTCYECGERGHLSSSCPNKKAADGAHAGNRTDDLAFDKDEKEADNVGDGKLKSRTCYECGERGHLSSSCPNKKAADGAHAGNRTDDLAFDKDEKEADNVGDGKLKRRTCYECGERGHLSSSCPNKKAADGAHAGNKTDDLSFVKDEKETDNVGDGKLRRRTCYECGVKGHLSSLCPNKKTAAGARTGNRTDDLSFVKDEKEADNVGDGKLKRRTCYECGEKGHLSSSCHKKQAADVPNSRSETFAYTVVKDNEEVDYNVVGSVSELF